MNVKKIILFSHICILSRSLMSYLLLFNLFFFQNVSFGQLLQRFNSETVQQFAARIKPDSSELAHQVIQSNLWDSTRQSIIVFYKKQIRELIETKNHVDSSIYNIIIGYLLVPAYKKGLYTRILIDSIFSNGGDPEIQSVFFCNADLSNDKELSVIITWNQLLHADYEGKSYGVNFYRRPDLKKTPKRLIYMKEISNKFNGCECAFNDGREERAKFKTAKQVKEELKRLGYKQ